MVDYEALCQHLVAEGDRPFGLASQQASPTGGILGEKPMWMEDGERTTVENTKRLYPGLYASGMAANNVQGGFRMGPIFGGMFKSGRKIAKIVRADLAK